MQEPCLTYPTSHLHLLQGKSHYHHYTEREMEAQGGDGIDRGHPAVKATPRLRESPYRLLLLHLPVGYCRCAPPPSAPPEASLPGFWHITCLSPGNSGKTHAISTWGCSLPNTSTCVPASPPQAEPRPVGVAPGWQCQLTARNRGETQELLIVVCVCWGWWNPAGSSDPVSHLPRGPKSVSCAADTRHAPLLLGRNLKEKRNKWCKPYISLLTFFHLYNFRSFMC